MAVYKNVASQKIAVYAYDTSADGAKTGDAANITAQISKDGGATAATNDTNPAELDATDAPGVYLFDMTQAETNADLVILSAVSATSNVKLEPVVIYTTPGSNSGVNSVAVTVSDKTGYTISTAGEQSLTDTLMARDVSNSEGSAAEHSLATIVLAALESSTSGTTWTIKQTDGTTTHATKTLTVDSGADPVTGVS